MGLAPYFDRAALAAAQIIQGFDEAAFRAVLEQTAVGLSLDENASSSGEGQALADLVVRLLARLYPRLQIHSPDSATQARLSELATAINPRIELVKSGSEVGIAVGEHAERYPTPVFAGSDGWDAYVGSRGSKTVGVSSNPFGAGTAACLAAANVFRFLFLDQSTNLLDEDAAFSSWTGDRVGDEEAAPRLPHRLDLAEELVLVGLGAIGHGALWALARSPVKGRIHLVDPQSMELSNLQRYVLASQNDEGAVKTDLAQKALLDSALKSVPHTQPWAEFVDEHGHDWPFVAIAVDSARDRRAVQASLPRRISNAWTQPGDLGVSCHSSFGDQGACVSCLYLPSGQVPNEDELVAQALGIPQLQQQVRDLLFHGTPVPGDLLEAVAAGLQVSRDALQPFAARSIRELYVEGLCGGAAFGLARIGATPQDVHVPLAHQSALAGVLLAAGIARHAAGDEDSVTRISRINVLQPLGVGLSLPAQRTGDDRCFCHDPDYVTRYEKKWPKTHSERAVRAT